MSNSPIAGLLVINKPSGPTSRDVVNRVTRLVKPSKAGHAGTLDPLASGVLIVCVGKATRLVPHLQTQSKVYRAKFLMGYRSETDDITGDVTELDQTKPITENDIKSVIPDFLGAIEQVPPKFSAVHVKGKRAYELARAGFDVEIAPRTVSVYRLELLDLNPREMELEIECGSGTYIRAIGRDIGQRLGTSAVMSELVRTRIGRFDIQDSVEMKDVNSDTLDQFLRPPSEAVLDLAQIQCRSEELDDVRCGRPIDCRKSDSFAEDKPIALLTPTGELAALARLDRSKNQLAPTQVFLPQTAYNEA